jgi:uncharacterized membrane protein YidH (DUF202 family)
MRISLKFIGGILVGFGLATLCFGLWTWSMLHHMFIVGTGSWPALIVLMVLPLLMIVLGVALAAAGRQHRNKEKP